MKNVIMLLATWLVIPGLLAYYTNYLILYVIIMVALYLINAIWKEKAKWYVMLIDMILFLSLMAGIGYFI